MLFRKKSLKIQDQSANQEMIAKRIAGKIINSQMKIASYLNSRTAHFSKVHKQCLLIGISVFFSAISLYLIFSSIN
jgi:hypothetical protein